MKGIELLIQTIALRPYVFAFLIAFLFSSIFNHGLKRTLLFWFGTWIIAFLSEYSSTRNGFPYGFYHYTGLTLGKEIFISNVPFFDSLSYTFLQFASYSLALFTVSPIRRKKWNIEVLHTFEIRQSFKILLLTTVYMMMIDVVIDPVALQGEKWFLGKLYYYDIPGYYFGVPISNALGWGFVGFVSCLFYQFAERRWFPPTFKDWGIQKVPFQNLFGVGIYYGAIVFALSVTYAIGEKGLFIAGCFIYLIPTVLLFMKCLS